MLNKIYTIREMFVCLFVCVSPFFSDIAERIFIKLSELNQWVPESGLGKRQKKEKRNLFENFEKIVGFLGGYCFINHSIVSKHL